MADTSLVFNILAKDQTGKTFDKMKAGAMVAGAAIGAALAGGAAAMLEKSKLDGLLAAQIGASPEMAAEFGKMSGELYAKGVGGSLEEVNAALKGVWQNGLVDEDATTAEIERVTGKVAQMATVMTEDADRVSGTVSQMLRTGVAKSSEEAFDLLQRGVEQGLNKAGDLLDTFNEYGTQFRKLGVQGPQAMGLIQQAMKAGARDSDIAADALKEFSIRAIDGSKTTVEGFKSLGLNAKKMASDIAAGGPRAAAALDLTMDKLRAIKNPTTQAAIATKLFGTQSEDLGKALFAMDPSKAAAGLGDIAGASDRAGAAMVTSGQKLDNLKRRIQMALVDKLAEAVPKIEATFGWLQKNSDWVVPLAIGLGIFAAAIYTIVTAMKVWTVVQTVLNLALWTSPVTWIVLGIVALVAIIVLIATKTTWFQTAWKATWDFVKDYVALVVNIVTTIVKTWWAVFSGFWTGVGRFFKGIWDAIVWDVKAKWGYIVAIFDRVVSDIKGLKGKITSAASGMWDGIKNSFRSAVNWIVSKWNNLSFTIGGGSIMGMNIPSVSLNTPNLPMLAGGGTATRGGLAIVGERGPEIISMSRGASVIPLDRAGGGTATLRVAAGAQDKLTAFIVWLIKEYVRDEGGGSVQTAFGKGAG